MHIYFLCERRSNNLILHCYFGCMCNLITLPLGVPLIVPITPILQFSYWLIITWCLSNVSISPSDFLKSCLQTLGSQMWNNSRVITIVPIWAGAGNEWKNMGKSKNSSTDFNYSKYFGGLWVYDCRTEKTSTCQIVRELIRENIEDLRWPHSVWLFLYSDLY